MAKVQMTNKDAELIVDRVREDPSVPQDYGTLDRMHDNFRGAGEIMTQKRNYIPFIGKYFAGSQREDIKERIEAKAEEDTHFEKVGERMVRVANRNPGDKEALDGVVESELPSLYNGAFGLWTLLAGGLGLAGGGLMGGGGMAALLGLLGAASVAGYQVYKNHNVREDTRQDLNKLAEATLTRQQELLGPQQQQTQEVEALPRGVEPAVAASLDLEACRSAAAGAVGAGVVACEPSVSASTPVHRPAPAVGPQEKTR